MKIGGGIPLRVLVAVSLLLGIALLAGAAPARAKTRMVNCASGESIGEALGRGGDQDPLVVIVRGTCNENVTIARDDVTLVADGGGGAVNGPDPNANTILVTANRVAIDGLTVTGGRNGIVGAGAARLTIQHCTVQNTGRNGIVFFQGSDGTVDDCTVQGNARHGISVEGGSVAVINSTISGNSDAGIVLAAGGNGRIGINNLGQFGANTISNNGSNGIHLQYGATAFIGGNTISDNGTQADPGLERFGIGLFNATAAIVGGNTITGNHVAGVSARASSVRIGDAGFDSSTNTITGNGISTGEGGVIAFLGGGFDIRFAAISGNTGNGVSATGVSIRIRNSAISGNTGHGVSGFLGTALDLRDTAVSGNSGFGVVLTTRSAGRMRGGAIQNNTMDGIRLVFGSGLFLDTPVVTVTGNGGFQLECTDGESSFAGNPSGIPAGGISATCTGF